MNKSESVKELIPSLVKFNQEVTMIAKDAKNPFFKNNYATLDQIIEQVRPLLSSHGLVVMQDVSSQDDGKVTVKTSLFHESGEYIESTGTSLKLAKNDPQGAGAGITYARRYDLSALLSLNTGEDDDGNSASGNQPNRQQSKQPPKQQLRTQSKPKTATMAQQNEIERKAKEYMKIQGTGTMSQLMDFLNISDLKLITENYANKSIKKLDEIIAFANKNKEEDIKKELSE